MSKKEFGVLMNIKRVYDRGLELGDKKWFSLQRDILSSLAHKNIVVLFKYIKKILLQDIGDKTITLNSCKVNKYSTKMSFTFSKYEHLPSVYALQEEQIRILKYIPIPNLAVDEWKITKRRSELIQKLKSTSPIYLSVYSNILSIKFSHTNGKQISSILLPADTRRQDTPNFGNFIYDILKEFLLDYIELLETNDKTYIELQRNIPSLFVVEKPITLRVDEYITFEELFERIRNHEYKNRSVG